MSNQGTDIIPAKELSKADKRFLTWANRKGVIEGERGILLEGLKLVTEGLENGIIFKLAWSTPKFVEHNPALINSLRAQNCPVRFVSDKLMKRVSDLDTPQGIVAAAIEPGYIHLNPGDPFSLIVVLTKAQDPGNVGAVLRICDYFGVDELWLGMDSADPFSARALRGAMGATFRTTVIRTPGLIKRLRDFRSAGATLWASAPHAIEGKNAISRKGPCILLIGGEAKGLGREYFDLADHTVSIRGAGRGESLNLAVATGILVHDATKLNTKSLDI